MTDANTRILELSFRWQNRALWKVAADALRDARALLTESSRVSGLAQAMAERGQTIEAFERRAQRTERHAEARIKAAEGYGAELNELASLVRAHRPELLEFIPEIDLEQDPTEAIRDLKRLEGAVRKGKPTITGRLSKFERRNVTREEQQKSQLEYEVLQKQRLQRQTAEIELQTVLLAAEATSKVAAKPAKHVRTEKVWTPQDVERRIRLELKCGDASVEKQYLFATADELAKLIGCDRKTAMKTTFWKQDRIELRQGWRRENSTGTRTRKRDI